MRNLHIIIFIICAVTVLSSCKSSQSSSKNGDQKPEVVDRGYDHALAKDVNQSGKTLNPNENAPSNLSLGDMLRKVSGVMVSGSGSNISVRVSGVSSFGPSDPLFVINGVAQGTDFARIATSINTNEITSITVLKGTDAAIYGSRGGNGVIVIRTR